MMLTASFYKHNENARGQAEGRAAQSELRKASESLRKLLSHDGPHSKNSVLLIDDAVKRLQLLRCRVATHAKLTQNVREEGRRLRHMRERIRKRLDEVDKDIAQAKLERANLLTQLDEIRRGVLHRRRALEVSLIYLHIDWFPRRISVVVSCAFASK